jgi:hypothetical protein
MCGTIPEVNQFGEGCRDCGWKSPAIREASQELSCRARMSSRQTGCISNPPEALLDLYSQGDQL